MCSHYISTILLFFIVSGSISTLDPKKTETWNHKFPPCQSCKLLVSSFQKGVEKTSRGKLEGGDAAWEAENNLSYATSEIRLIEILEKVCEEVDKGQHQCHTLAEENESLLEEWWKDQFSLDDLQTWLCIEKLKVCCPDEHYGKNCTPCKGYPDNVCNSNGKCKGSGTRKGNGDCSCAIGYEGDLCDKCTQGYYESYRDENKLLCSPCHNSCQGSCTQAGPKGCLACKPGWQMNQETGCHDINECLTLEHICTTHQFCVNNEGSFTCLECDKACLQCDGDGPDMCLECADGFVLNGKMCQDGRKHTAEQAMNLTRYVTYLGLCIATCIIFQKNTAVASLIGLAVALYISVSEYMLTSGKANSNVNFNVGNVFQAI